MGDMRNAYVILTCKSNGKFGNWRRCDVVEMCVILWNGFAWLRIKSSGGFYCGNSNGPPKFCKTRATFFGQQIDSFPEEAPCPVTFSEVTCAIH